MPGLLIRQGTMHAQIKITGGSEVVLPCDDITVIEGDRYNSISFKDGKIVMRCTGPKDYVPENEHWVGLVRAIALRFGWAIGVHGTLKRDIDLIAVPWTDEALPWIDVYFTIVKELGLERGNIVEKPRGRHGYILLRPGWRKAGTTDDGKEIIEPSPIDISVFDPTPAPAVHPSPAVVRLATEIETAIQDSVPRMGPRTTITVTDTATGLQQKVMDPRQWFPLAECIGVADSTGVIFDARVHERGYSKVGRWRKRRGRGGKQWAVVDGEVKEIRPRLVRPVKAPGPPKLARCARIVLVAGQSAVRLTHWNDPVELVRLPSGMTSRNAKLVEPQPIVSSVPRTKGDYRRGPIGFEPQTQTRPTGFEPALKSTVRTPLPVLKPKPPLDPFPTVVPQREPYNPKPVVDHFAKYAAPVLPAPSKPASVSAAASASTDYARTHTLWVETDPGCPSRVLDGGEEVCKRCGAAESELDAAPCPKAFHRRQ